MHFIGMHPEYGIAQEMTARQFAKWFTVNAARLARLDPERAAEKVAHHLGQVDRRLGVEVADSDGGRELIVSAAGDASLFALVDEICAELKAPGWTVHALKPPRGFESPTT
jgi:hypothetical protein